LFNTGLIDEEVSGCLRSLNQAIVLHISSEINFCCLFLETQLETRKGKRLRYELGDSTLLRKVEFKQSQVPALAEAPHPELQLATWHLPTQSPSLLQAEKEKKANGAERLKGRRGEKGITRFKYRG